MWQGKIRTALQSAPSTERRHGFTVSFKQSKAEKHSFRAAREADRETLLSIFHNPVKAAYEATQRASGTAPTAPCWSPNKWAQASPTPSVEDQAACSPPCGLLGTQALASQALMVPSAPPADHAAQAPTLLTSGVANSGCIAQAQKGGLVRHHESKAESVANAFQDNEQCLLCGARSADTACVPCGHLCGCEPCLQELQASASLQCPTCQLPVTSLIRIHRS